MAKGPLLTNNVKLLIAKVYEEHHKWKAPMVRNEVDLILHDKKLTGWPSLSAVQKVLATIRQKERQPSPEDKPWHMSTLNKYPIPPEALPFVLKVWVNRSKDGRRFTIREAKWAGRLYAVFKDKPANVVETFIMNYAWHEEAAEKLGYPPDLIPPHTTVNVLLADVTAGEELSEETIHNILKSDMASEPLNKLLNIKHVKDISLGEAATKEAQNERTHNQEG